MIKPDVMDGVPNNVGIYLVNDPIMSWRWKAVQVREKDVGGPLYGESAGYKVKEENFDRCTWSERIAEPTTNVDNLNDG